MLIRVSIRLFLNAMHPYIPSWFKNSNEVQHWNTTYHLVASVKLLIRIHPEPAFFGRLDKFLIYKKILLHKIPSCGKATRRIIKTTHRLCPYKLLENVYTFMYYYYVVVFPSVRIIQVCNVRDLQALALFYSVNRYIYIYYIHIKSYSETM